MSIGCPRGIAEETPGEILHIFCEQFMKEFLRDPENPQCISGGISDGNVLGGIVGANRRKNSGCISRGIPGKSQ